MTKKEDSEDLALPPDWQLCVPLDAIIFDCDGTLSHTEGIDHLAALRGNPGPVRHLTEVAMGQTGIQPDIYAKRLSLIKPQVEQMRLVGESYIQHVTEDIPALIQLFQEMGKQIFVVSAGLSPTVRMLSAHLGIPDDNVFAVDVVFDSSGHYIDFDHQSVLTSNLGKRSIVHDICQRFPRAAYVGDGMNDCPVRDQVTRFVGYGGVFYRENVAALSHYYIQVPFMAPLLPLTLTAAEQQHLPPLAQTLYQKGWTALTTGGVLIQHQQ